MSKNPRIRIWFAFDAFAGGVSFIISTPSVWLWSLVPIAMMGIIMVGLSCAGIWGADELANWIFGQATSTWGGIGKWTVLILLSLLFFVAATLLALLLAEPLSGFALEKISREQERQLRGRSSPPSPFFGSLLLNIRCVGFCFLLGGSAIAILLVVNLLFPPASIVTVPLKLLVFAWMLAWDFIDYPMCMRKQGLRKRLRWVWRNFGAFTLFGITWVLFLVVPGLVLLILPMGVAGGTRLVMQDEPEETE